SRPRDATCIPGRRGSTLLTLSSRQAAASYVTTRRLSVSTGTGVLHATAKPLREQTANCDPIKRRASAKQIEISSGELCSCVARRPLGSSAGSSRDQRKAGTPRHGEKQDR